MFSKVQIFVRCNTKEKAEKFLAKASESGCIWNGDDVGDLTENSFWDVYQEETCYCLNFIANAKRCVYGCEERLEQFYIEYELVEFDEVVFDDDIEETEDKVSKEIERLERQVDCLKELVVDLQKKISFLKSTVS
jgi:hypothetical protein